MITLRPLSMDNLRSVVRLQVASGQREFLASNADSIAEAYVEPAMRPLAIYADDELVGFTMYGYGTDDTPPAIQGRWWVIRFMIDERFQRLGYGRNALLTLIKLMCTQTDCRAVFLGVVSGNEAAMRFYEEMGFRATGEIEFGEIVMTLECAACCVDEDTTICTVILSRSEGSLGVSDRGGAIGSRACRPAIAAVVSRRSDPSLRLRMTVQMVVSSSTQHTAHITHQEEVSE